MYTRMPFGKHKGRLVSDVESGYLCWVVNTLDDLDPYLRRAIEAELRRRDDVQEDERDQRAVVPWDQVLKAGYSEMARRFHPDRGGSVVQMQTVNTVFDRLRELAAEAQYARATG